MKTETMKTLLARAATSDDNRVLLLDGEYGFVFNNVTNRTENGPLLLGSIRHALRHDFGRLTVEGANWLRTHATS